MVILFIIIGIILLVVFSKLFMIPMFSNLSLISGAVKSGKSTFSVYVAKCQYYRVLFSWYVHRAFVKFINFITFNKFKLKVREKPLFYSNIPIVCKNFVPVDEDLLMRRKRFAFKSVIFIDEASLVADSMLIKNMDTNERLQLFNKLIGHSTHGGYIFYNSQAIEDLHFSIKRCVGTYFYVHHKVVLPFFVMLYVRELFYAPDGTSVNTSETTVTETFKRVLVPKRIWKDFDCYAFSAFTDNLPVADEVKVYTRKDSLKVKTLFSFREFNSMRKDLSDEEKN